MGRYCDHTFVCIKSLDNHKPIYTVNSAAFEAKIVKPGEIQQVSDATKPVAVMDFAIVACLYCGQIRHVSHLGEVTIAVEEGNVIKKRNEQPTNPVKKI